MPAPSSIVLAGLAIGLAAHASAAGSPPPTPASGPAFHRAPTTELLAPGTIVASGENESDPVLYRIANRYYLFTSDVPGLPLLNVPVTSTTDFDSWAPDPLPRCNTESACSTSAIRVRGAVDGSNFCAAQMRSMP